NPSSFVASSHLRGCKCNPNYTTCADFASSATCDNLTVWRHALAFPPKPIIVRIPCITDSMLTPCPTLFLEPELMSSRLRVRPSLEQLEDRTVPALKFSLVSGGLLLITGSPSRTNNSGGTKLSINLQQVAPSQ